MLWARVWGCVGVGSERGDKQSWWPIDSFLLLVSALKWKTLRSSIICDERSALSPPLSPALFYSSELDFFVTDKLYLRPTYLLTVKLHNDDIITSFSPFT